MIEVKEQIEIPTLEESLEGIKKIEEFSQLFDIDKKQSNELNTKLRYRMRDKKTVMIGKELDRFLKQRTHP